LVYRSLLLHMNHFVFHEYVVCVRGSVWM
jgi:hypothetical protein